MKKYSVSELNRLYDESERLDKDIFLEFRSNLLLIAGEHYTKNSNKYFNRLRETNNLTATKKLRVTKNLCHKIVRYYENAILSKSPGVSITPRNPLEIQDKKEAELNKSVWLWGVDRYDLDDKIMEWAGDFCGIGEVATKIFWDPSKGDLIGYAHKHDDAGQPMYDQDGDPVADEESPIFSGDFVFEPLQAFNLLRDPTSRHPDQNRFWGVRKMSPKKELMERYKDDEKKLQMIQDSKDTTYIVFDSNNTNYGKTEKEVLLKEFYFKPCLEYPEGYFYIFTDSGILEEGALPFGIYPIVWQGFDIFSTSARARGIIKVARPYQAEINRASSQMATHQTTLGDDKVLYQSGTKLVPGSFIPGVRGISYQGAPPTVLPGRDGGQFSPYLKDQKSEMYEAVMLDEMLYSEQHNLDPYSLLFRVASEQTKFNKYIKRFQKFLVRVAETYLALAKHYLEDHHMVAAIGKNEMVNIAEFRNTKKLHFSIKVEPGNDSIDTMLGKQLTFNHLLQYVGKDMDKGDIGRIIKNMPFVNNEDTFDHLTIDQDNVENDMLAIERGELPTISRYANNELYVKMLSHRMKKADYKFLNPQIQSIYEQVLMMHEQEIVRKQQEVLAAQNEYIPIDGPLVTVDMYMRDPETGKPKKTRIPQRAVDWLIKTLDQQGASLENLEQLNQGALAELAQQLTAAQEQPASPPIPVQTPGPNNYLS